MWGEGNFARLGERYGAYIQDGTGSLWVWCQEPLEEGVTYLLRGRLTPLSREDIAGRRAALEKSVAESEALREDLDTKRDRLKTEGRYNSLSRAQYNSLEYRLRVSRRLSERRARERTIFEATEVHRAPQRQPSMLERLSGRGSGRPGR